MKLTLITGNQAKADLFAKHLNRPLDHQKIDLDEIQSLDLEKIIEHKARGAYEKIGTPVIVDDVSLQFNALSKLPGPFIRWFLDELGNEGLCKLLDNYDDHSAFAEICLGYFDGKSFEVFKAEIKGTIAEKPRGDQGFGWDPIFIPEGYDKTWGEMTEEERNKTYYRPVALKKLEQYLTKEA